VTQPGRESWWSWRRSMFAYRVVSHLAEDGQQRFTSVEYPGEPWVVAACGQKVEPDGAEPADVYRCPECLVWWERQYTR
jgi:hypothetical protein